MLQLFNYPAWGQRDRVRERGVKPRAQIRHQSIAISIIFSFAFYLIALSDTFLCLPRARSLSLSVFLLLVFFTKPFKLLNWQIQFNGN